MSDLVIVESPAKAKTIKKYLGGNYEVIASMGHVRDLPKARLSVDIKKKFAPKYEIIKGKEKLVEELKDLAEKSDKIYLAVIRDPLLMPASITTRPSESAEIILFRAGKL